MWAVGTLGTLLLGPVVLALWLAPFAAAASAQAARTWRRDPGGRRPVPPTAFAAAAVAVLGAPFGLYPFVGTCLVGAVGSAMWSTSVATRRAGDAASGADVVLTLVCAAVPVAAVAGPVLLRSHGLTAALVLLVYALVYDTAAWVVGTDARYAWIGPAAGSASILSATVAVAAITQFKGGDAWVLGGLAAVLAPLGAGAATLILGDRRSPVPALRRLDSLVLLGPVWAVTAARLGV